MNNGPAQPLNAPLVPADFDQERTRLLSTLGLLVEGGLLERLDAVGATSVPELPAAPCLDIGLAIWPYPLSESAAATLTDLGYAVINLVGWPGQCWRRADGRCQLFIAQAGSPAVLDGVLLRDHLREDVAARRAWAARKQAWATRWGLAAPAYQAAKAGAFPDMIAAAHTWWVQTRGFTPLTTITQEFAAYPFAWYVASGWALDLFLNRVTRVHHDVDIVIPRADQINLQLYLADRGWRWLTPLEARLEPWPRYMRLEMPRHQAHAHRAGAFIDCLLTDIEHGAWRYRRAPAILRAHERMALRSPLGVPYLSPELVLLFKSRNTSDQERTKDQTDFECVAPHLEAERRAWLRWALTATTPDHPWLAHLT